MTKARLQKYRDRLRLMAAQIRGTAAGLEKEIRKPSGSESAGPTSASHHPGDMGTDVYMQELGAALLENEQYIQGEIEAALERIEAKTYGKCENCGQAIPEARLDALPYARHCTPCAATLQAGQAVNLNTGRDPRRG